MIQKASKPVWGWAFYDWANSAFSTTVVAAFFPVFFKKYWAVGLSPQESTFYLGTAMSLSAFVFAAAAPFLGSFADLYGWSKKGLMLFTALGSLCCALFFFVPGQSWFFALAIYALAWLGYSGANLFYDALIVNVSDDEQMNWVSCFGYSLGYLGGGLLIIINALMVTQPQLFGLADSVAAVKWSFLSVGVWWFLFSLPTALWVPESVAQKRTNLNWKSGFYEVINTLRKITGHRNLLIFLIAYFFYIDGVHTIYKMAVDFALAIHLDSDDLIKAIIIVQFVGFPATFFFSALARWTGTQNGILIGIVIYAMVCFLGSMISTATHFYLLAVVLGLVQGGVQALSRSLYAQLIPKDQSTEFFGFYNMFGKFSAVLGPFLVGITSLLTESSRASLWAILLLFVIGGSLLYRVSLEKN